MQENYYSDPDFTISLLSRLTDAHGATGFEGPIREILETEWSKIGLKNLHVDRMGNFYAALSQNNTCSVLLMAHMDEVGFLVREITEEGMIKFDAVGGWLDEAVTTQRWVITTLSGNVTGYTGVESGHIIPGFPGTGKINIADLFIDIGATSRSEVIDKYGIRPGLPITPNTKFEILNNSNRYLAKAFDDRVGLAVITEVVRNLQNTTLGCDIKLAATVQEEVGMRGAEIVFASTAPDIVLNVEVGIARDFPKLLTPGSSNPRLGYGPSIFVYDGSLIPNNLLVDWTLSVAQANDIQTQFETGAGYSEDASELQRSGRGTIVSNFGVPARYVHSQSGMIDRSDYDALVKLMTIMTKKINPSLISRLNNIKSAGKVRQLDIATNKLVITPGETIAFNKDNLVIKHEIDTKAQDITIKIENVTNGYFSLRMAPNKAIKIFSLAQLENGLVQFTHQGNDVPSYSLAITDGLITRTAQLASVLMQQKSQTLDLSMPTAANEPLPTFIENNGRALLSIHQRELPRRALTTFTDLERTTSLDDLLLHIAAVPVLAIVVAGLYYLWLNCNTKHEQSSKDSELNHVKVT